MNRFYFKFGKGEKEGTEEGGRHKNALRGLAVHTFRLDFLKGEKESKGVRGRGPTTATMATSGKKKRAEGKKKSIVYPHTHTRGSGSGSEEVAAA